jgi:Leucine-rich repeat (LRR) protein
MLVGSFLDPGDLRVCTTQLCSSGTEFVSNLFAKNTRTILLHELVACCPLSAGVDDVAIEGIKRIESFLARCGEVQTIIMHALLYNKHAMNANVYSDIHRRLRQGSSFQFSLNQGITVEWHVSAESVAQVEFMLCSDVQQDGARVSDAPAGVAYIQYLHSYLHTLDLSHTQVSDLSGLASCQSLHSLDLMYAPVSDVSALASCQSLHTLDLSETEVSDVSPLASCESLHTLALNFNHKVSDVSWLGSCQSLHTLYLCDTPVSDVSALASCPSLHTLNLACTLVIDVSVLASCRSLHTLDLSETHVSDVSALASCQSLHSLILWNTQMSDVSVVGSFQSLHTLELWDSQVSDVSGLASCQSLHTLDLRNTQVSDVSALASSQSLRKLLGVEDMVGGTAVLRIIQGRG